MKKHLSMIIIFLLLVSNVLAISLPLLPFPFGQEIIIDGKPASNLMIKIEDKNYDVIKTNTNEEGQFLVDLSNLGEYSIGDSFNVTVYRGEEERSYLVVIKEEEGGIFFTKEIQWDSNILTESEGLLDLITMRQLLITQRDEITAELKIEFNQKIDELNAESDKKVRTERWISISVALMIGVLFLVLSSFVTAYYSKKYGKKITQKRKK